MTDKPAKLSPSGETATVSDIAIRNMFRRMMQGCILCTILFNRAGKPSGYSVVSFNDAVRRMLSDTPDSDFGQAVRDFLGQIDLLPAFTKAIFGFTASTWEQYMDTRGKWYSFSTFGLGTEYAVVQIEDITPRKVLEKQLGESLKRYETFLKQSSDAIAIADFATRKIIEVNARLCSMTGYTEAEMVGMSIYSLLGTDNSEVDRCQTELAANSYLPAAISVLNCKNGLEKEVERVVSLISYEDHCLEYITLFDISEERKLQQIIKEDAVLASQVQRQMLPADRHNERVEIRSVFKPLNMVSGDFFDYRLSEDGTVLTGFLVDVAGHGLAAALQTAAINVLLQEVILQEKMPTQSKLRRLNKQMMRFFSEGTFAALMIFRFDFAHKSLVCACCGINQVLAITNRGSGWIKAKGSMMGAFDMTEFDIVKLPLHPGDCFYFLTDGLSDNLAEACLMNMRNFDVMTKTLTELAAWKGIKDDCTAICIKINGAPHQYSFSGMDDMEKHQPEIRRTLRSLAGEEALHLEIVLNEAVNNVLLHGSGQGCVRIRKIGARIILRVKDLYKGFNAEAVFKPYETQPAAEIAEKICFQENGRGVLLMKLFTDKILYNRSGREIMLISRIVQSPKETGPVHAKG